MGWHPGQPEQDGEVDPQELPEVQQVQVSMLHLGQGNLRYEYRLREELTEIISAEDLGVLVDEKLDISQQHTLTAKKGNHTLSCLKRGVASRLNEEILSFYCAA